MKQKIVILMITTLIILTAYFVIIPVKASESFNNLKPLVLLRGATNFSLEEEGYDLENSNVNPDMIGSYEAEYTNKETGDVVIREVEVIDLENGYYKENMTSINTFKDYPVELLYNESYQEKHILIVKFISDTIKNTGYVFMYLIENNQIIKEVSLYFNVDLAVEDLKIIDDHFIMTGSMMNTLTGNIDIFVRVNRLDGLLIYDECFGGSNHDIGYQIIETSESYIVGGKTQSNDKDFISNINNDANFIMSLSKDKREIKNVVYNIDNIDYSQFYLKNKSEDTYLCYNTPKNQTMIKRINNLGNITEEYQLPVKSGEVLQDIIISDKIELGYTKDNKVIYYVFTLGEEPTNLEILVDGKIENIKKENDKITVLARNKDRSIYKVYNNNKLVYELLLDNNQYILKDDGVIYCEEKKINVYDINYLIIETLGDNVLDNNGDYHDYKVIMNGDYIIHNDKTVDSVKEEELGKYIISYCFEDDFTFMFDKEIYVYEDVGVYDGGIYDIGTIINVNNGVLNNEHISGEYILNKEGDYSLILNGHNLTQELHFEVRKLSVSDNVLEKINTILELDITEPILETKDVILKLNTIADEIDTVENNFSFMYTIPIMLTIAFTFVIIKIKF